jgi:hypothetical protein
MLCNPLLEDSDHRQDMPRIVLVVLSCHELVRIKRNLLSQFKKL